MNPEKKTLYTAQRSTIIDLHTNFIVETWQKLRDDADTTNWMLTTIDGTSKIVHLAGSGDTCLTGLQGVVQDDDIYFGGVFIVGKDMPAMQKGKKIMFKNNIMNAFEGAHGEINISTGTEGLEEELCRQITSLTGTEAWFVGQMPRT